MKHKPFGYPIPHTELHAFLDPDGTAQPHLFEGHTYYQTDWWTLRTAQHIADAIPAPRPIATAILNQFELIPATEDPKWKPLDDIAKLINKFPARIWERTRFRHHLQSYPVVRYGTAGILAQKGVLQLATRLPGAHIYPGIAQNNRINIRFKGGHLILQPLPAHWHLQKPALTLHGPKAGHPMDR